MAVDLIQLAAALRLGDGEIAPTEPVAGLLSRLLGVSQAFVAVAAPDAPEAIADEATIRMTAYLYDAPTAAAGDRYAAAWRNSGAEALVSRWVVRRAGSDGEGVPVVGPSTGGLDDAQVRAIVETLVEEHADIETAHHTPPTGGSGQAVITHDSAGDAHEDIRDAATAAQTAADGAQTSADAAQTDIDDHEANHPGGETPTPTPATPTPPMVLVDAAAYAAHGDVTAAGWRHYDFVQLFYAVGGTTYMTPPVNTVQLIGLSPLLFGMSRNVAWTLAISTTDDDVINVTQSTGGNTVPAPTATSTMTVIAWRS